MEKKKSKHGIKVFQKILTKKKGKKKNSIVTKTYREREREREREQAINVYVILF